MIAAALEYLEKTAKRAAGIELVDLGEFESDGSYGIHNHATGKYDHVIPRGPLRNYTAESLAGFVKLVSDEAKTLAKARILVLCGKRLVTAILAERDEVGRREAFFFELRRTREVVCIFEGLNWFTQRDFLRLLRVDFARAVDAGLVAKVRKIKVSHSESTGVDLQSGQESLTREVKAALKSEGGDLPDEIVMKVYVHEPLIALVGYVQQPVKCVLEINPSEEKPFGLFPLPGELERAVEYSLEWVETFLTERFASAKLDNVLVVNGNGGGRLK